MLRPLSLFVTMTTVIAIGWARPEPRASARPVDPGPALVATGDDLMRRGDAPRAAQYFEAALHAGHDEVLGRLLAACVASRQYELAVEHAEAALARNPNDAHLRALVGALDADTGQLVKARENLERAATERPQDADLQFTTAVFFRDDARDPERADAYFRAYLAAAPAGQHAREAKASLLRRLSP